MTVIVPRIAGITPELSAFYENLTRENNRAQRLIEQLDDLVNDTRVSLGLTDERLGNVQDQVGSTAEIVAASTSSLFDRITTIETDYTNSTWNKVTTDLPSITIPAGAYDQEMTDYALIADKKGWYRLHVSFKIDLLNLGVLYLRCVTPQMIGWGEGFPRNAVIGAAVTAPVTGKINTEFPVVANNAVTVWGWYTFLIKLDANETARLYLTKTGTLTLSGTIGPDSNISLVYIRGY